MIKRFLLLLALIPGCDYMPGPPKEPPPIEPATPVLVCEQDGVKVWSMVDGYNWVYFTTPHGNITVK